jgi:hypothetical protein
MALIGLKEEEVAEAGQETISDDDVPPAAEISPPPSPHKILLPPAWLTAAID